MSDSDDDAYVFDWEAPKMEEREQLFRRQPPSFFRQFRAPAGGVLRANISSADKPQWNNAFQEAMNVGRDPPQPRVSDEFAREFMQKLEAMDRKLEDRLFADMFQDVQFDIQEPVYPFAMIDCQTCGVHCKHYAQVKWNKITELDEYGRKLLNTRVWPKISLQEMNLMLYRYARNRERQIIPHQQVIWVPTHWLELTEAVLLDKVQWEEHLKSTGLYEVPIAIVPRVEVRFPSQSRSIKK